MGTADADKLGGPVQRILGNTIDGPKAEQLAGTVISEKIGTLEPGAGPAIDHTSRDHDTSATVVIIEDGISEIDRATRRPARSLDNPFTQIPAVIDPAAAA